MDSQELKLFQEDSDEVEHDDEGEEEEEKVPVGKKRKVPVIDDAMKLKGLKHWLDFANNPLAKDEGVRGKAKVRKELLEIASSHPELELAKKLLLKKMEAGNLAERG